MLWYSATQFARMTGPGNRRAQSVGPRGGGAQLWGGEWLQSLSRCLRICGGGGRCDFLLLRGCRGSKLVRRAIALFGWQSPAFPCSLPQSQFFPSSAVHRHGSSPAGAVACFCKSKQTPMTRCCCCSAPGLRTRGIITWLAFCNFRLRAVASSRSKSEQLNFTPFARLPLLPLVASWTALVLEMLSVRGKLGKIKR